MTYYAQHSATFAVHGRRTHCLVNVGHTQTTVLLLFWNLSGTTRVSRYQKRETRKFKTNLDLLEQDTVSGSGICWAIFKSAPHPRQPHQHPTTQFFAGRMPFLLPNQQHQSTEGNNVGQCYVLNNCNRHWLTAVTAYQN